MHNLCVCTEYGVPSNEPGCRLRPLQLRDDLVDHFLFTAMQSVHAAPLRSSSLDSSGPAKALVGPVKSTPPSYA